MGRGRDDGDREGHGSRSHPKNLKSLVWLYLPPWLAWLMTGAAGVTLHVAFGRAQDGTTTLVALAVGAGGMGLVWLVRRLTAARSDMLRTLAGATVIGATLWTTLAVPFPAWSAPLGLTYLIFGAFLCVGWTVRRAALHGKEGNDTVPEGVRKLAEAFNGARPSRVTVRATKVGPVIEGLVELDGKQTSHDLPAIAKHADVALAARPGSTQLVPDPENAARAILKLVPGDTLASELVWTGPDRPGASIAEPISFMTYVDGEELSITLPGDEDIGRNLAHILAQGMTGAGKTGLLTNLMTSVVCRSEVNVIAIDPVKGLQSIGPFVDADALTLFTLSTGNAKMTVAAIQRAIKARANFLGARRIPQWRPGCGLNLLVLWCEEANWATDRDDVVKLSQEARSAGIVLLFSQQRASYHTTSTDLRANMGGAICLGLEGSFDAKFNLPDTVAEAVGDQLAAWRSFKPGYAIVVHPSIPEERWQLAARGPKPPKADVLVSFLRSCGAGQTPLDDVTAEAFGEKYLTVMRQEMAAVRAGVMSGSDTATDTATAVRSDTAIDPDDMTEPDNDTGEDDMDEPDDADMTDPETADGSRPVPALSPDMADLRLGDPDEPPARPVTSETGRRQVESYLRGLAGRGVWDVTPADVHRMEPPLILDDGVKTPCREWCRQELKRRMGLTGALEVWEVGLFRDDEERPGLYHIVQPIPPLSVTAE